MVSPSARPQARPSAAFTLIELLTVVAIIGILAAITLGVSRGVTERAAINQARAELSALAVALESYKLKYGDYPQVGAGTWTGLSTGQTRLLQALIGKRGPLGAEINQKSLIDITKFSLTSPPGTPPPPSDPFSSTQQDTAKLLDPWGREYLYAYTSGWSSPTYVLLSVGPDGYVWSKNTPVRVSDLLNADGTLKQDASTNSGAADNIYSN